MYLPDYNNFANICLHKHFKDVGPCSTLILHLQSEKKKKLDCFSVTS